jgi:hypothetical protein
VESFVDALPFQLGIRLALDSISYSNPLPYWVETVAINYSERARGMRRRVIEYLDGARPKPAFSAQVPKKNGQLKTWLMPTVNDQIIFQTCVSSIAESMYTRSVDPNRVFSYRYNTDPNRLALIQDAITGWNDFQDETRKRCLSNECLLQFDIAEAFASIDRTRFSQFLVRVTGNKQASALLSMLTENFSGSATGLPLINDSVFFLGNAYLSEIDSIVRDRTSNFIRFVDDYRIFGKSREDLARLLEDIERRLRPLGYKINSDKVRLGTGQEYLDAISRIKYEKTTGLERHTPEGSNYITSAIFSDIIEPHQLVDLVQKTVENPDEHLNEGLGRLQLAALKKMRINGWIACERNYPRSSRNEFSKQLSSNVDVIRAVTALLKAYSPDQQQIWRSIWLLYLSQDINISQIPDKDTAESLRTTLQQLRLASHVPVVVKLWANTPFETVEEAESEQLHDAEYFEWGHLLFSRSLRREYNRCKEDIF